MFSSFFLEFQRTVQSLYPGAKNHSLHKYRGNEFDYTRCEDCHWFGTRTTAFSDGINFRIAEYISCRIAIGDGWYFASLGQTKGRQSWTCIGWNLLQALYSWRFTFFFRPLRTSRNAAHGTFTACASFAFLVSSIIWASVEPSPGCAGPAQPCPTEANYSFHVSTKFSDDFGLWIPYWRYEHWLDPPRTGRQ